MKRVLSVEFAHETNTFCLLATQLRNFEDQCLLADEDTVIKHRRRTRTSLGATYEAAEKYGWSLCTPVAASANPAGRITDETFEHLVSLILKPLQQTSVLYDGILYHLHGAMVSESYEDAEGELLRRTRALVGESTPIIVTLDLHGNISPAMASLSNALIAVRTYPHIDAYERAWQAAELLQRSMLGEVIMRTVIAKRPMLKGLDGGKTQQGPMRELLDRAESIEKDGKVLVISICAGFTAADIFDIGPSVTVTYDKLSQEETYARAVAESLMDTAWQTRSYVSSDCLPIVNAIAIAKSKQTTLDVRQPTRPIIFADVTDNPGSGHYGDATNLLKAMIEAKLPNAAFYAIYDPAAVKEGIAIGVGNIGTINLGGKHDANAGGPPLTLSGKVVSLTDGEFQAFGPMGNGVWQNFGLSMLFRVDGIEIAVITNNGQVELLHIYTHVCRYLICCLWYLSSWTSPS
jgi:microcystin degradation protein MlrC